MDLNSVQIMYLNSVQICREQLSTLTASVLSPFLNWNNEHPFDKSFLKVVTRPDSEVLVFWILFNYFLLWTAFFITIRHLIFHPIARNMIRNPTKAQVIKFGDSGCEFTSYSIMMFLGFSVVLTSDWYWPDNLWWSGHQPRFQMREDLRCWFLLDIGRYSSCLFSLIFLEHTRKDFWPMFFHHIATILVTYFADLVGGYKVGCIVKLVMDPADVFLHAAKNLKYIGDSRGKDGIYTFLSNRCFDVFAVSFFVTRIICYGYVYYSCLFEFAYHRNEYRPYIGENWDAHFPIYCAVLVLLGFIFILQLYWGQLIGAMALEMLQGGELKDTRSDDEDDDEELKKKKD